jgi:hypothetical protein
MMTRKSIHLIIFRLVVVAGGSILDVGGSTSFGMFSRWVVMVVIRPFLLVLVSSWGWRSIMLLPIWSLPVTRGPLNAMLERSFQKEDPEDTIQESTLETSIPELVSRVDPEVDSRLNPEVESRILVSCKTVVSLSLVIPGENEQT